METKQLLLNNQWITEEIKEILKKYIETKYNDPKPMECSKSSPKMGAYSDLS